MNTPAVRESAHVFECAGESLCAVLTCPPHAVSDLGVVIVVGGPQYRAGSHRQFVLLARALAAAGYPVWRFDARGMGDASGDFPGFESIGSDIRAAMASFQAEAPSVRRVVLWGLCDGASASLMYAAEHAARGGPGVAGLILLNPWVRHDTTFARAQVKAYYGRRLLEPAFWRKLFQGQVRVGQGLRELAGKLWQMRPGAATGLSTDAVAQAGGAGGAVVSADFRERMVAGLTGFRGPLLFLLSGRDHTCAEFLEFVGLHPRLRGWWSRPQLTRVDMAEADHTFSSAQLRDAVAQACCQWLNGLGAAGRP